MVVLRNPDEPLYAICSDALDKPGYVLKLGTDGKVAKATSNDVPFGIAYTSTKDPITEQAQSNVEVAVIPVRSGFVVKVLKETGAGKSLSPGDYVAVGSTDGVVDKWSADTTDAGTLLASLKKIVGKVIEAAGENDEYAVVKLVGI